MKEYKDVTWIKGGHFSSDNVKSYTLQHIFKKMSEKEREHIRKSESERMVRIAVQPTNH